MAKLTIKVDPSEALNAFENINLKKQTSIIKASVNAGAYHIAYEAAKMLHASFKPKAGKPSQKAYDMANSIGYAFNPKEGSTNIYPTENNNFYYSFMAKWFIAGTKNRYAKSYERRKRKSGKLSKRRYRDYSSTRGSRGKIEGNDIIVKSYNANYLKANELIREKFEKLILKAWEGQHNGKGT